VRHNVLFGAGRQVGQLGQGNVFVVLALVVLVVVVIEDGAVARPVNLFMCVVMFAIRSFAFPIFFITAVFV
jgi:hypothetical protein